jgi:hypothetical protein
MTPAIIVGLELQGRWMVLELRFGPPSQDRGDGGGVEADGRFWPVVSAHRVVDGMDMRSQLDVHALAQVQEQLPPTLARGF